MMTKIEFTTSTGNLVSLSFSGHDRVLVCVAGHEFMTDLSNLNTPYTGAASIKVSGGTIMVPSDALAAVKGIYKAQRAAVESHASTEAIAYWASPEGLNEAFDKRFYNKNSDL